MRTRNAASIKKKRYYEKFFHVKFFENLDAFGNFVENLTKGIQEINSSSSINSKDSQP